MLKAIAIAVLMVGCVDSGEPAAPDGGVRATGGELALTPFCGDLDCAYTICSSCPVCGHPEWVCQCYQQDDSGEACERGE